MITCTACWEGRQGQHQRHTRRPKRQRHHAAVAHAATVRSRKFLERPTYLQTPACTTGQTGARAASVRETGMGGRGLIRTRAGTAARVSGKRRKTGSVWSHRLWTPVPSRGEGEKDSAAGAGGAQRRGRAGRSCCAQPAMRPPAEHAARRHERDSRSIVPLPCRAFPLSIRVWSLFVCGRILTSLRT